MLSHEFEILKGSGTERLFMVFRVVGPRGVVVMRIDTGWSKKRVLNPMPFEVSLHSPVAYAQDWKRHPRCDDLPNSAGCFTFDLSESSQEAFETLLDQGTEGLWRWLETVYEMNFPPGGTP